VVGLVACGIRYAPQVNSTLLGGNLGGGQVQLKWLQNGRCANFGDDSVVIEVLHGDVLRLPWKAIAAVLRGGGAGGCGLHRVRGEGGRGSKVAVEGEGLQW